MIYESIYATVEKLLKYSTPFGHIWVALTFLCRLIPVAAIGGELYGDEFEHFQCLDGDQPGCKQMCYNKFSPMSHIRFWNFQILVLCFPSLIFSMVAANYNSKYHLLKTQEEELTKTNPDYRIAKLKRYKTKQVRHKTCLKCENCTPSDNKRRRRSARNRVGAENAWVLCSAFVVQTAAGDCLNVHSLPVATENAQQYQGLVRRGCENDVDDSAAIQMHLWRRRWRLRQRLQPISGRLSMLGVAAIRKAGVFDLHDINVVHFGACRPRRLCLCRHQDFGEEIAPLAAEKASEKLLSTAKSANLPRRIHHRRDHLFKPLPNTKFFK